MKLIDSHNIDSWARSKSAESTFPQLIKNLISAVVEPDKLRMPSGDTVWLPGYDGIVINTQENPYVPLGQSVWELGTDSKYKTKANKDYEKRSTNKEGCSPKEIAAAAEARLETSFVFVTPFPWPNLEKWVNERNREGIWKEVIVIDGVALKDWLEAAPAVNLQFAALLGLAPEIGLSTPEQAWEDWSRRTKPPTSEELVVAGRSNQVSEFKAYLTTKATTFIIRGHSPVEAWGFALAALRRISPVEDRENLHARTIVAENEAVASGLRNRRNLIVILKEANDQVSGSLSTHGTHLILPEGNDAHSYSNMIELPRSSRREFVSALENMGLPAEQAEKAAISCGLSVTVFQRQFAQANFITPGWVTQLPASQFMPVLLAGRWNAKNESDQEVIRLLAGAPTYAEVENDFYAYLRVNEPPLQKIGEMWVLTAPVDSFQLMARNLTPLYLDRFETAFREVFGKIDPKVEVNPDEWMHHDLKETKSYSEWLRSGMAETLLLIADRGQSARMPDSGVAPQQFVDRVVRGIPGLRGDWRILASIRDQFSRLIEAAPDPLLDSLEHLLEAKPADMRRIFSEGSSALFGGAMHTGLLWGLETLSWSPQFLTRAALILADLASIDPGGQLSNRPVNSLREIFLWWHPGTNASTAERLAVIDLIIRRQPIVGWNLLTNLLPSNYQSISHSTVKPRWRDFGDVPASSLRRGDQFEYVAGIVDRSLRLVEKIPERWRTLLISLPALTDQQQDRILQALADVANCNLPSSSRAQFWNLLRDYVYEHKRFKDAHWAASAGLIDRLEAILSKFSPESVVEKVRWLFNEWHPDLPEAGDDYKHAEAKIRQMRLEAVRDVFEAEGINGLLALGLTSKFSGLVAASAIPLFDDCASLWELVISALSSGEIGLIFASQLSGEAHGKLGSDWRKFVLEADRNGLVVGTPGSLYLWWPDTRETWNDVEQLGEAVSSGYWQHKPLFLIKGDTADQSYQVQKLIAARRAADALHSVALDCKDVPTASLLALLDATLQQLFDAKGEEDIKRIVIRSDHIKDVLSDLRRRPDVSKEQLARREYAALPLLGYRESEDLTIHEFMASDPSFFVDVICTAFLPASRDRSKDEKPTAEASARAQAAYRLLEGMKTIPGQKDDGSVDEGSLTSWIEAVRELAEERDRRAVTDLKIGEILAHAKADSLDGAWPHRSVRNLVERFDIEDLKRGLIIERHNMRGVYSKALYEGGAQERALAKNYRNWASTCRENWPVTAQVLDRAAEGWEADARRADLRAEQDKLE